MYDTSYGVNETINDSEAHGYKTDGSEARFIDLSLPYAAGALLSTVNDLAKWDTALYDYLLLNETSTTLMFRPSLNDYALGWTETNIAKTGESIQVHGGGIPG